MTTTSHPDPATEVMTISRVTLNYVVIAVAFLALGIFMGWIAAEQVSQSNQLENEALIDQAVARIEEKLDTVAVAANENGSGEAPRLQVGSRYEVDAGENPSLGATDALVTIVEFSDFQCGYCGRYATETLSPLMDEYGDRVQIVYRDFIIFGQQSYAAALAAHCAHDQEQFWGFHDLVFANQRSLSRSQYISFAEQLELDMDTFTTCYDSETHRENIADDVVFAESLGVTGTPAFFINGRFVSGAQPYEVFAQIIDEELARVEAAS
jgi:protein-disulfide isomerase